MSSAGARLGLATLFLVLLCALVPGRVAPADPNEQRLVARDLGDERGLGVGDATVLWGRALRLVQSGEVQHYALAMALGAVAILGMYLLLLT